MPLLPLYYVFFFTTLLIPGYVASRHLGFFRRNPGAELAVGYALTILFFAFLATLSYAANINTVFTRYLTLLIILFSLFEFIRKRYYKEVWEQRFPLICMLVMSTLAILFVALPFTQPYRLLPDPNPIGGSSYKIFDVKLLNVSQTQANDNSIPYRQAQFFVNRSDPATDSFIREWDVNFFVRTPLMGAVTANYFNLLNEKPPSDLIWRKTAADPHNTYMQFQILASILNSLLILPAFYLISIIFNKKTALISCLFITVNPYFLYNTFYTWPKSLVAFFVLASWLLLMEKRKIYTVAASIMLAAAYLTHDLAILYVGATVVYLLLSRRFKDTVIVAATPLIFVASWILTSTRLYQQPSNFIYYPFSLHDIPQVTQHDAVIKEFRQAPVSKLLHIRLQNIYFLLTPFQLFSAKLNGTLPGTIWTLNMFSIPGALGVGLLPAAFIAAFKRTANWKFWTLVIVPVLLESVIIGWPYGLGAFHFAQVCVVLLTGVSIYFLTQLKKSYWLMLAYGLNVANLLLFMTYSYRFAVGGWFNTFFHSLIALCVFGIILSVSWLVYGVQKDTTPKWLQI